MLRVNKVEDWLRRAPTRPDLSTRGDCVIIRSSQGNGTYPGTGPMPGVSGQTAGPQALRLHLAMIPARTRGMPHFHADHDSAIYTVSGETEIWHGDGLVKRTVIRAGDFMYVPTGIPHLAVNRSDVMTIAVVAGRDPEEREGVVVVELPRHLADLLSLPVAVRELPQDPAPRLPRGSGGFRYTLAAAPPPPPTPRGFSPPSAPNSPQFGRGSRWCSSGNPRPNPGTRTI